MIENSIEIFYDRVLAFMIGKTKITNTRGIVRKHSENLQSFGDFSFPNRQEPWNVILIGSGEFTKQSASRLFFGKNLMKLVDESTSWDLRVKHMEQIDVRIHMFLDRSLAIPVALSEGLRNKMLISKLLRTENTHTSVIIDTCAQPNCLTFLRVNNVSKVISNLCVIHEKSPDILVTSNSTTTSTDRKVVLCMPVLNAKTGSTVMGMTGEDYIRFRQDEMEQKARLKYGATAIDDMKDYLIHLGESAVTFELLQAKLSSAIKINFDSIGSGASKGVTFLLYNCARLETVITKFNLKVHEGTYPPSPCFEEIDFDLLTLEDEWSLIFNYILGFPPMIKQCVEIDAENCKFRPDHICNFLSSMAKNFSQYYRRTKILLEPRNHLLPLIYARIHMLKVLNNITKTCLRILNMNNVSRM